MGVNIRSAPRAEAAHEPRISRRTVLTGSGAALVVIALGSTRRADTRGVFDPAGGQAFAPWTDWQAEGQDVPIALVSAAILASNAHNAQPWLFRVQDTSLDLFEDTSRSLGSLDPFGRELHIGLGCALENLLLAAPANGYEHKLLLGPDPADPGHVATVALSPGRAEETELYSAIPHRHTNRYPFDTSRPVSNSSLTTLGALNDEPDVRVHWFTSRAERDRIHELLAGAAADINADPEQSYDNGPRWLRQDKQSIEHHRDGLTLDTMGLAAAAVLAAKMLPDPGPEEAGRAWLASVHEQAGTAGAFGILAVRDDRDRAQRIRVGRIWQRIHLWTTVNRLAAQPMNQLHERADREAQLGLRPEYGAALEELLGDPGWRALFTFRIGHPTQQAPPSPRRPVPRVLTT
ncbi:hypothetical protein GCM10022261_07250 [Brevibacterium daeguense]|uniref:Nitroreductase family protein n=1 Tax=Brevibacterium daeguense TaxID=909936 RepID=A0ABP8EGW4_9MICO|nr:hypothetical protein [Brevibacterium daeguense]